MTRTPSLALLAFLAGTLLVACPSGDSKPPPVDHQPRLEARIDELRRAWIADRYDVIYELLEPSYRRIIEKGQYEKADREKIVAAELLRATIEGQTARVELKVTNEDRVTGEPVEKTVTQRWILEAGEWYLAQRAD